ncbi:hypothetical protein Mal15_21360 [Stieleria maiorica]|uniref:Uncharacterized protein n=1 Tax=Stieleria maiorica TaxID=2795974 RepID=A0A5B9MC56_9BACT|nr:hypothetical protein Mal15_21360 [Stieleria maiorica]
MKSGGRPSSAPIAVGYQASDHDANSGEESRPRITRMTRIDLRWRVRRRLAARTMNSWQSDCRDLGILSAVGLPIMGSTRFKGAWAGAVMRSATLSFQCRPNHGRVKLRSGLLIEFDPTWDQPLRASVRALNQQEVCTGPVGSRHTADSIDPPVLHRLRSLDRWKKKSRVVCSRGDRLLRHSTYFPSAAHCFIRAMFFWTVSSCWGSNLGRLRRSV